MTKYIQARLTRILDRSHDCTYSYTYTYKYCSIVWLIASLPLRTNNHVRTGRSKQNRPTKTCMHALHVYYALSESTIRIDSSKQRLHIYAYIIVLLAQLLFQYSYTNNKLVLKCSPYHAMHLNNLQPHFHIPCDQKITTETCRYIFHSYLYMPIACRYISKIWHLASNQILIGWVN